MSKQFIKGHSKPSLEPDGEIKIPGCWQELHLDTDYSTVRALGKPTDVHRGVHNGFSLPVYAADNEELFYSVHVPHDWDESTDFVLKVYGYIDTANDTKNFQLRIQWDKVAPGTDTYGTTDTDVDTETATGASASQYQSYETSFTIAASTFTRGVLLGIVLQRIAASSNEITGEFVLTEAMFRYRRNTIGLTA